jgi:hypothetical protein
MTQTIQPGDISIEVTRKDIKNIHLSVRPPDYEGQRVRATRGNGQRRDYGMGTTSSDAA